MTNEEAVKNKIENRKRKHYPHLFGPFFLIALGVLLLLNNFGLLSWDVWNILWKFWPIILVVWGIEAIFGHGLGGYFLVSILGLILLAFVIFYSISLVNSNFDSWAEGNLPFWSQIEKRVPSFLSPKQKVFHCDTITGECNIIYR